MLIRAAVYVRPRKGSYLRSFFLFYSIHKIPGQRIVVRRSEMGF